MTRPEASNVWAQFTTKTSFGLIKIYNLLRSSGCPRITIGPKRPPKTWPYVAAGHKGTTPDSVLVLEVAHKSNLVGGFNPSWKISVKMGSSSPGFGMKIKKIWNHHPVMFRVHLLRTAKKKTCHWPTAASGQLSAHDCEHAPFMPTQSSRAWNSYREIHPCKLHHSPHRTAWNLCLARVCGSWMTIVEFIEIQGKTTASVLPTLPAACLWSCFHKTCMVLKKKCLQQRHFAWLKAHHLGILILFDIIFSHWWNISNPSSLGSLDVSWTK